MVFALFVFESCITIWGVYLFCGLFVGLVVCWISKLDAEPPVSESDTLMLPFPCPFPYHIHKLSIIVFPLLCTYYFSFSTDPICSILDLPSNPSAPSFWSNKHSNVTFSVGLHRKLQLPNSGNRTQSWLWTDKNRRFPCESTSQPASRLTSKRRIFSACSTR